MIKNCLSYDKNLEMQEAAMTDLLVSCDCYVASSNGMTMCLTSVRGANNLYFFCLKAVVTTVVCIIIAAAEQTMRTPRAQIIHNLLREHWYS